MAISVPVVTVTGLSIVLQWRPEQLKAVCDRWHESRDGMKAEVTVTNTAPEAPNQHLHQSTLNLSSLASRKTFQKQLDERAPNLCHWGGFVEQLCVLALKARRQGESAIQLVGLTDPPIPWRVNPLVLEGQSTILFGDGGTSKSYIAWFLACLLGVGGTCGRVGAVQGNALYLDYECDQRDAVHRATKFRQGMPHLAKAAPYYRRMTQRLPDDLPALQRDIGELDIKFLIIDSIALAVHGKDVFKAETATEYFMALRVLNVSSLTIAHTAKEQDGKRASVYGSVFFQNIARSVWEAKKVQEVGECTATIGLYQTKTNAKPVPPLGFTVEHAEDDSWAKVTPIDLAAAGVPEIDNKRLPLKDRVKRELQEGAKGVQTLSETLTVKKSTLCNCLDRHEGKLWVQMGGKGSEWMLIPPSKNGIEPLGNSPTERELARELEDLL